MAAAAVPAGVARCDGEREAELHRVVELLRLGPALDSFVGGGARRGISGGELKRLNIATELLARPRLLFLDEPLSGLDVTTAQVVKELMHEFAGRGGAVLHCSHLLDVVEHTAHRIAVLDKGKLLAQGTAAELREQAGAGAATHLDQVFRSLVQASDPAQAAKPVYCFQVRP